ncbi:MAG: GAF domain-containing protein, partial [Chloroflexota bacterium]
IEDEPEDAGLLQKLFTVQKRATFQIEWVDRLQKGLTRLAEPGIDVVLLDLSLPDSEGLQTFTRLQSQAPNMPVIVLTALADEALAIQTMQAGAQDYLVKGEATSNLLVRSVRYAIERKRTEEDLRQAYEEMEKQVKIRTRDLLKSNKILKQQVVEKDRAEASLQAYAERLVTLHEIDQAILEARSPDEIAQAALSHIRHLIPCERASLMTFDFTTNEVVIMATDNSSKTYLDTNVRLPIKAFHPTTELQNGEIKVVRDISNTVSPSMVDKILQDEGINAYISVPLIAQQNLMGVLNLGAGDPTVFTTERLEIAREITNQIAVAIQQADLNEQVQRDAAALKQHVAQLRLTQVVEREQRELATTLREISSTLNETLDLTQVLRIILEQLVRVLACDYSAVLLLGEDELTLAAYWSLERNNLPGTPLQIDKTPQVQRVMERQSPVIVPNTKNDPNWVNIFNDTDARCWLGTPLVVQNQVIGMLSLTKKQPFFYNELDAELSMSFADQAAIAVKNAQLFEQAHQEIQERIRAETALQKERESLAHRVAERTSALSAANAELARTARLKDEFLASMSHELRTPLNAILGLSEALQEQVFGPQNEEQLNSLKTIEESGRHLLALINDVLDVSKIEAGKLTLDLGDISVEMICQACLGLIKQTANNKQLEVQSYIDPTVVTIQADNRRLKQILVNLLSNAVKFTPEGGKIGLEVTSDPVKQTAMFTVWDTGVGIKAKELQQLFKPFVQLDSRLSREHSGTGLGLALVSRLTELHGGGVSVESAPNQGSRFTISLPWKKPSKNLDDTSEDLAAALRKHTAASRTRQSTAYGTNPPQQANSNAPTILLAEDNEGNINIISSYLRAQKYQVIVARTGEEAVKRTEEEHPYIILMDIQMPVMDG